VTYERPRLPQLFYQRPGGEDQVFADEVALLRSAGHAVETFTVHNDVVAGPGGGTLLGEARLAVDTLWNRRVAGEIAGLVRRTGRTWCTSTTRSR
jgi:hypothetical protein